MSARSPYDPPPGGDFAAYVERLSATPVALRGHVAPSAGAATGVAGEVAETATRVKELFGRLREQAEAARPGADGQAPASPKRAQPDAGAPAAGGASGRAAKARRTASRAQPAAPTATAPPKMDDATPKTGGVNPLKYFVLPFIVAMFYSIAADFEPRIAPYETPILVILFGRGLWLLLRDVAAEVRRRQQAGEPT